jgi:Tol biopolymer transport system component/DNA-binding winged helix-turn-helix (wHTH) protein
MSTGPYPTYAFGAFELDLAEHRLLRNGHPVPLTPKMFELLRVLVVNAGHLVEKERLLQEVWADTFVDEANLNRGIFVLRKTLGETARARFIETVPKRGYRFVATVRTRPLPQDAGDLQDGDRPSDPAWTGLAVRAAAAIAAGAVLATLTATYALLGRSGQGRSVTSAGSAIHRQLTFTGKEITPVLSPDGSRIAYVSKESPDRKVVVREVTGGEPLVVFSAPEAGALRWSPGGAELMFWARGNGTDGQYIAPVSGEGARKLVDGFFVSAWSPDGATIALALFASRQRIVFLNRVGEVKRTIDLSGSRAWIWDLDWSRVHGRLLYVAEDDEGRPTIWTIRPDGTEQSRAFTGDTRILGARWAPAGDAIYYFTRVNQTVSLFKVPVGGNRHLAQSELVPLISGLQSDEGFGLSADGTKLVYARAPYHSNLWLVEPVGSGNGRLARQTQLTHGTAIVERPRVAPDGGSIVFSMGDESRADLYTLPAAGGTPKQLTSLNAFSVNGVWSPDGRTVAFASTEGGKARVWLVDHDGSSPRPLSAGDMSESFHLVWSPGARLLYQQIGNRNFYVMDPRSPEERLLIKDSSVGWTGFVAYSPDGQRIAVSWNRPPRRGLWLLDADGSRETLVYAAPTPSDFVPYPIGWSSDGRFIYGFDGKRAAYRGRSVSYEETVTDAKIMRVPASGGSPETILSLPFEEVGTVAMFPDGRRFLCTVYSSGSDVWIVENFDAAPGARQSPESQREPD